MLTNEQLAEIAYNAYCENRQWKSVRGEALPDWKHQHPDLQVAWIAASSAVAHAVRNDINTP